MASFHPMMLHSLTILEAICYSQYQDTPTKASRPYDINRSGFLPSEGGAVLIFEQAEHAKTVEPKSMLNFSVPALTRMPTILAIPLTKGKFE